MSRFGSIILILFAWVNLTHAQNTITLRVDATDAPRNILHTEEFISVKAGALTLLYPQWIPGEHGPTGPIIDVVNLKISANGKPVPWNRDLVNMYSIHLDVPKSVSNLMLTFDLVMAAETAGFSSGASASAKLALISWNQVLWYPDSPKPDNILCSASLKIPMGWKYATALKTDSSDETHIHFASVNLNKLVDSPVLAGAYFKQIDLTPKGGVPQRLNIASDGDAGLNISPDQIRAYKNLVVEASALFGATHFDHYDFLFTLSDHVAHFGLEHHESSDNRIEERSFTNENLWKPNASLLAHEMVHSWNGKYRRPVGFATSDFSTPMKGDMLWVYEGMTQYLGKLLTARSGLLNNPDCLDDIAYLAAELDNRPGREWRPLQDTGDEAQLLYYSRSDWDALRRSVDFYDEGVLLWLEVDVTIRQLSKGKQSLDDFCKKFHGGPSSGPMVKPYTFDDIVSTLNSVAANDWKTFLITRLQSLNARAPLGGIESAGWKLVYTETPNTMQAARIEGDDRDDVRFSMGMMINKDQTIRDIIPGMASASAGLAPGMKIVAVNGRAYSKDVLQNAIRAAKNNTAPIEILAENKEFFSTYSVSYHGGEKFPHLERVGDKTDWLSVIMTPTGEKK